MKKNDGEEKMEEMPQKKVEQMIKSVEGCAGLLHKSTKPTAWSGAQILKKKKMQGCWTVVKQRGTSVQSIGSVMRRCRMWRKSLGRISS